MTDESETSEPSATDHERTDDQPPETRRMRRAIAEIQREGWKVAVIYAIVDAALVTLVANLILTLAEPTVSSGAIVGVALGVAVFAVEVGLRVRRPLVEQFEAANPGLHESLRTARDAVADGRRSRIATRLYEDVLDDLRQASSIGLLDLRRVTVTVVAISLLSLATIQLAAVDLSLLDLGGPGDDQPPDGRNPSDYDGLQDGSSILGEPEDVPTGEENLAAIIDTSGSGSGGPGADSAAAYDDSGYASSGSIESQQAAFSGTERIENAELIREYNLRIREVAESDT